jgi:hypothetical protein
VPRDVPSAVATNSPPRPLGGCNRIDAQEVKLKRGPSHVVLDVLMARSVSAFFVTP